MEDNIETKVDENGTPKYKYVQKIDLKRGFDFSELNIDKLQDDKLLTAWQVLANKMAKELAFETDKASLKSAFPKAKLYDEVFNPYTVTEHEKRKAISDFCTWLLTKIEEDQLRKKDIVEQLKHYVKP